MSYQTSIHFDPTALLIIKNEVDNFISIYDGIPKTYTLNGQQLLDNLKEYLKSNE